MTLEKFLTWAYQDRKMSFFFEKIQYEKYFYDRNYHKTFSSLAYIQIREEKTFGI